jgi:hypothetical protein
VNVPAHAGLPLDGELVLAGGPASKVALPARLPVQAQTAAAAAGGLLAGAALVGLARRRRHGAVQVRRGGLLRRRRRRGRPGAELLEIVASRSLLLDIHLLDGSPGGR